MRGAEQAVYRADIDKISGWRLHLQLIEGKLYLRDIIEGQKHDDVLKVIKRKKICTDKVAERVLLFVKHYKNMIKKEITATI